MLADGGSTCDSSAGRAHFARRQCGLFSHSASKIAGNWYQVSCGRCPIPAFGSCLSPRCLTCIFSWNEQVSEVCSNSCLLQRDPQTGTDSEDMLPMGAQDTDLAFRVEMLFPSGYVRVCLVHIKIDATR